MFGKERQLFLIGKAIVLQMEFKNFIARFSCSNYITRGGRAWACSVSTLKLWHFFFLPNCRNQS